MKINQQAIDRRKCRPKQNLYIALMDLDFSWFPSEVEQVQQLWQAGEHIADIAQQLRRDEDEVAILIIDLARQGKVQERKNGAYGEK